MQLEELRRRGVDNIGLVVADGVPGLEDALSGSFSGTPLQWCTTHIKRNVMSRVRSEDKEALGDDLRGVFRTDDPDDSPEAGWARWQSFCEKWSQKYSYFNKLRSEPRYRNGFTYLNYDYRIRSMIYTTNWIERLNRSFRRVLKMRLSMPDEESVLVLLGTVARNQRAYGRRLAYMDKEKTLFPQQSNSPWKSSEKLLSCYPTQGDRETHYFGKYLMVNEYIAYLTFTPSIRNLAIYYLFPPLPATPLLKIR